MIIYKIKMDYKVVESLIHMKLSVIPFNKEELIEINKYYNNKKIRDEQLNSYLSGCIIYDIYDKAILSFINNTNIESMYNYGCQYNINNPIISYFENYADSPKFKKSENKGVKINLDLLNILGILRFDSNENNYLQLDFESERETINTETNYSLCTTETRDLYPFHLILNYKKYVYLPLVISNIRNYNILEETQIEIGYEENYDDNKENRYSIRKGLKNEVWINIHMPFYIKEKIENIEELIKTHKYYLFYLWNYGFYFNEKLKEICENLFVKYTKKYGEEKVIQIISHEYCYFIIYNNIDTLFIDYIKSILNKYEINNKKYEDLLETIRLLILTRTNKLSKESLINIYSKLNDKFKKTYISSILILKGDILPIDNIELFNILYPYTIDSINESENNDILVFSFEDFTTLTKIENNGNPITPFTDKNCDIIKTYVNKNNTIKTNDNHLIDYVTFIKFKDFNHLLYKNFFYDKIKL